VRDLKPPSANKDTREFFTAFMEAFAAWIEVHAN
jgi:hypothetical protein